MKYNIIELNILKVKMASKIRMFLERRKKVRFGGRFGGEASQEYFFGGGGALPTSDDRVRSAVAKMGGDGPRYQMIS